MHKRTPYIITAAAVGVATVSIGSHFVQGADSADETVFVPVTPCRLIDTRPGDLNVGPRAAKVGEDESVSFAAWAGDDGNSLCEIPATATAIATNTVAVAPTARSFMTLYPADVENPGTANLNYVAGQAPTPNAANVPLSAAGEFSVYNAFGEVHVVIDVNGYYQPSSNVGSPGPAGPAGQDGAAGADGEDGEPTRISRDEIAIGAWYNDPGAATTIDNGEAPAGIATDGSSIYVTNGLDSSVSVIDPISNTVVEKITVGTQPLGIGFDGSHLYVTNNLSGTVTVIDPATRTVVGSPIPVGTNPLGVAYASGAMYVANRGSNDVSVIDTSSNTVVATIPLGLMPFDVVFDGSRVFVSTGDATTGAVVAIDPATNTVDGGPITTGRQSQGLTYTGTNLYVANANQATISVIDTTTLTVVDTLTLGSQPVDVEFDGTLVYAVINADDMLIPILPATGAPFGSAIPTGDTPNRIIFDGTNLFVTNFLDQSVSKILPPF